MSITQTCKYLYIILPNISTAVFAKIKPKLNVQVNKKKVTKTAFFIYAPMTLIRKKSQF